MLYCLLEVHCPSAHDGTWWEDQELGVSLDYTITWRPAWITWSPVSKKKMYSTKREPFCFYVESAIRLWSVFAESRLLLLVWVQRLANRDCLWCCTFLKILLCLCAWCKAHLPQHTWRSEGNFMEWVLSRGKLRLVRPVPFLAKPSLQCWCSAFSGPRKSLMCSSHQVTLHILENWVLKYRG